MAEDKIQLLLEIDDKGNAQMTQAAKGIVDKVKAMAGESKKASNTVSGKLLTGFKNVALAVGKITLKVAALTAGLLAAAAAAVYFVGGLVFKSAIGQFAEFETALVDMGKVTSQPLQEIRQNIMALDPALGSATELTKGYYNVISAGVTEPVAALNTLTVASQTAKAAHVDQGEVIKGLTKVMAGYQGEIKDAAAASDLLFTIEKEGQTNVAELIPVIGSLSAMSHELGVSQYELGGALAQTTQTAGSTAEAATQYKGVLKALQIPSKELSQVITEMGYESAQSAIKSLGFAGALEGIKDKGDDLGLTLNDMFRDLEGYQGILALSSNNFDGLTKKVEAMEKGTGAAKEAWEQYKGTLVAIWETSKNTVGKMAIEIGEKLAPKVKEIVEKTGEWLTRNKELVVSKISEWLDALVQGAGWLVDHFDDMVPAIQGVANIISTLVDKIKWLVEKLYDAGKAVVTFVDNLRHKMPQAATEIERVETATVGLGTRLIGLSPIATLATAGVAKAVSWISGSAVEATEAVEVLGDALDDVDGSTVKVDYLGEGSAVKPLTEKTEEMTDLVNGFCDMINSQKPELTINVSPARQALNNLLNQYKTTMATMLQNKAWGEAMNAQNSNRSLDYLTGAYDREYTQAVSNTNKMWTDVIDNAKKWGGLSDDTAYLPATNWAANQARSGTPLTWAENKAMAGYALETEYATRTEPRIVHRGEKIIREDQPSPRTGKQINVEAINIVLPASAANASSPQDWKFITRNYIRPELERLN